MSLHTYLTAEELAIRIECGLRTVRERLKNPILLEGGRCARPFGGRKILCLRKAVEKEMPRHSEREAMTIPMANGGICHG